MKKQLAIFVMMLILLSIVLCGCEELQDVMGSEENKFYGEWTGSNNSSYVFCQNGTLFVRRFFDYPIYWDNFSGSWELKDNRVYMYRGALTYTYEYFFSDDKEYLTLGYPGSNEYFGSLKRAR